MKKSGHESAEVTKNFEKFDICHHCKLLYPDSFLVKCKYTSDKMGVPIQPAQYCDPYLIQISKCTISFILSRNFKITKIYTPNKLSVSIAKFLGFIL